MMIITSSLHYLHATSSSGRSNVAAQAAVSPLHETQNHVRQLLGLVIRILGSPSFIEGILAVE